MTKEPNNYDCCFDIETSGLDKTKDHIIQIAMVKYDKASGSYVDSFSSYVKPEGSFSISYGSFLKHGITAKLLEDKPTLRDIADKIIEFFKGCDIIGYNHKSFDIPFLVYELRSIGYTLDLSGSEIYDAFNIEREHNGNNLESTFLRHMGKSMEQMGYQAHDALSDVKATYDVFKAQKLKWEVTPEKMCGIDNMVSYMMFKDKEEPCLNIGKYRGVPLRVVYKVDKGYIDWVIKVSGFDISTKEFIKEQLGID